MQTIRPRRSVLYMPGSNARAIEKARTLAADAVILDLEDAVAPDAKAGARQQVAEAVKAGGFGSREVVIRVNAADTPWHEADLAAAAEAKPDAILLPKVSAPEALRVAGAALTAAGTPATTRIWAMIETPQAIMSLKEIARAASDPVTRLACFVMGTNDLAKETRARFVPSRMPFLPWLTLAITAARAGGIDILDGVYNELKDEAGFLAECEQGRDLGFDGKTLIHPNQIEAANAVFAPSEDEVSRAKTIIEAFDRPENRNKGAIELDGRMVERLHAEMGRRLVALSEAIAALG